MRKIILIGYMAVGKSTIAQLLAEKIKWEWVDLDKLIEKKMNLSINEIFNQKGEIFFRKMEQEVFKEILDNDKRLIVSTGGGTPCYSNNHLLMIKEDFVSIYLNASIDTIFERLKKGKANRPLVANNTDDSLKEFIAKNLFDRSFFYNQATNKIKIDNKTPEEIVEEISKLLH